MPEGELHVLPGGGEPSGAPAAALRDLVRGLEEREALRGPLVGMGVVLVFPGGTTLKYHLGETGDAMALAGALELLKMHVLAGDV